MKHKWKITPQDKKIKNYDCELCQKHVVAVNKKEADSLGGECESFFLKWSRALEIIEGI